MLKLIVIGELEVALVRGVDIANTLDYLWLTYLRHLVYYVFTTLSPTLITHGSSLGILLPFVQFRVASLLISLREDIDPHTLVIETGVLCEVYDVESVLAFRRIWIQVVAYCEVEPLMMAAGV